jgi:phosphoglycolate phosphatase-like HAD superfamily hydrolase
MIKISPSVIVTDYDDTIVASRGRIAMLVADTFRHMGRQVDTAQVQSLWGVPFEPLVCSLAGDITYPSFLAVFLQELERVPPIPLPGALEFICTAHRLGIPLLLLSAGSRPIVRADLRSLALLDCFSKLWCYEDSVAHKPNPVVMEPIIDEMNAVDAAWSSAVYVGDSLDDCSLAMASGIRFIAVLSGSHTREDFTRRGVDDADIVTSLGEVELSLDPEAAGPAGETLEAEG